MLDAGEHLGSPMNARYSLCSLLVPVLVACGSGGQGAPAAAPDAVRVVISDRATYASSELVWPAAVLDAVSGNDRLLVAVGADGAIVEVGQGSSRVFALSDVGDLHGVWVDPRGGAWAVGSDAVVRRRVDGSWWRVTCEGDWRPLRAVHGDGDRALAVGDSGAMAMLSDERCSVFTAGSDDLCAAHLTSDAAWGLTSDAVLELDWAAHAVRSRHALPESQAPRDAPCALGISGLGQVVARVGASAFALEIAGDGTPRPPVQPTAARAIGPPHAVPLDAASSWSTDGYDWWFVRAGHLVRSRDPSALRLHHASQSWRTISAAQDGHFLSGSDPIELAHVSRDGISMIGAELVTRAARIASVHASSFANTAIVLGSIPVPEGDYDERSWPYRAAAFEVDHEGQVLRQVDFDGADTPVGSLRAPDRVALCMRSGRVTDFSAPPPDETVGRRSVELVACCGMPDEHWLAWSDGSVERRDGSGAVLVPNAPTGVGPAREISCADDTVAVSSGASVAVCTGTHCRLVRGRVSPVQALTVCGDRALALPADGQAWLASPGANEGDFLPPSGAIDASCGTSHDVVWLLRDGVIVRTPLPPVLQHR